MKLNKLTILALGAALSMVFTACDDDDVTYVGYGEAVAATGAPLAGQTGVNPRTTDIIVNFNTPVKAVNTSKIMVNDYVPDSVSSNGNDLLIYMPGGLKASTEYTVNIYPFAVSAVDDDKHSFIEVKYTFSFTTGKAFTKEFIATAPVNAAATAEAKKVYSFLLENYGEKTLSGAMADIAWGEGYFDFLHQKTGKYPAIAGFDYIHMASSEQGANWINYRDITPVKKAWEAGSIPAFTWHWLVPEAEDADPDNPMATFENVVYAETFDCANWGAWLEIPVDAWADAIKAGEYLIFKVKDGAQGAIGICDADWNKVLGVDYYDTTGNLAIECTQEFIDAIKSTSKIIVGGSVVITGIVHADSPALEPKTNLVYDGKKFSPLAAMTPGTSENAILEADIATVAQYLDLLQQEGIPVLWRPFHEAAGDYTNGAWFWWGNDGVEATKQLWIYLYNKLTNEYHINNLIWVWTMQTTDGGSLADSSLLKAAYPGDEYVDIVGTDLYKENTMEDVSAEFNLLSEAIGQRKIIALSEVGNLPDFEMGIMNEAYWSYFMNWYGRNDYDEWDFFANDRKTWRKVLALPFVLNQGDFNVR